MGEGALAPLAPPRRSATVTTHGLPMMKRGLFKVFTHHSSSGILEIGLTRVWEKIPITIYQYKLFYP